MTIFSTDPHPIRAGIELVSEGATWGAMLRTVQLADKLQLDSLWTWDHLLPIAGSVDLPILEGWTTIAAWAAVTVHPTVGLLAGANSLRHPAVVAKAAVSVDHISQGRCILGLGAGSSERDLTLHGIPSGATVGERLSWLGESVEAIKTILAGGSAISPSGSHYSFAGVRHFPAPFLGLGRLRLLIGGSGLRRTLPIAARYADLWNPGAPTTELEYVRNRAEKLNELCASLERNPREIERTLDPVIVIRSSKEYAQRALENQLEALRWPRSAFNSSRPWLGPPAEIADTFRPYRAIGFTHLIAGMLAPYDQETVEGMAEVRRLLLSA